jgi:hypothetical protein
MLIIFAMPATWRQVGASVLDMTSAKDDVTCSKWTKQTATYGKPPDRGSAFLVSATIYFPQDNCLSSEKSHYDLFMYIQSAPALYDLLERYYFCYNLIVLITYK